MIARREAITGIGALPLAAITLSYARQSAAAAPTGKVAVSGGDVSYWVVGEGPRHSDSDGARRARSYPRLHDAVGGAPEGSAGCVLGPARLRRVRSPAKAR
jgi:hypothetical protein